MFSLSVRVCVSICVYVYKYIHINLIQYFLVAFSLDESPVFEGHRLVFESFTFIVLCLLV